MKQTDEKKRKKRKFFSKLKTNRFSFVSYAA